MTFVRTYGPSAASFHTGSNRQEDRHSFFCFLKNCLLLTCRATYFQTCRSYLKKDRNLKTLDVILHVFVTDPMVFNLNIDRDINYFQLFFLYLERPAKRLKMELALLLPFNLTKKITIAAFFQLAA